MPTPYDVPAPVMIDKLANYLRNNVDEVKPPEWALYVKTGAHTERSPYDPAWWFTRCASLLRKIYVKGPMGIQRLRSEYGGRKDRGTRPEHSRRGGGAIVRKALQQLEAAGLVETSKRGRVITKKGRQLLDMLATETRKDMEKEHPDLKRY